MNGKLYSIGVKLLAPIFGCFVLFAIALMVTIRILTSSTSADAFKAGVNLKDDLVYRLIEEQRALLEKKARWLSAFAGDEGIIAEISGGADPQAFQARFDALAEALDVDGIALADREGYLLISSGGSEGARYVRTIVSYTDGQDCITRMYSLDTALELISAIPVIEDGNLGGYGFIEYSIQSQEFADELQKLTQCEIDIYQGPLHRNSSTGSPDRKAWITPFTGSISSNHDVMIETVLGLGETYRGNYTAGGVEYYGIHFPLKDFSDSRVGIVSMSLPIFVYTTQTM
jgi:hypothetical protein